MTCVNSARMALIFSEGARVSLTLSLRMCDEEIHNQGQHGSKGLHVRQLGCQRTDGMQHVSFWLQRSKA